MFYTSVMAKNVNEGKNWMEEVEIKNLCQMRENCVYCNIKDRILNSKICYVALIVISVHYFPQCCKSLCLHIFSK